MSPELAVFQFADWFGMISAVLGIGDDIVSVTGQAPVVELCWLSLKWRGNVFR
jgi:hypothetical protein